MHDARRCWMVVGLSLLTAASNSCSRRGVASVNPCTTAGAPGTPARETEPKPPPDPAPLPSGTGGAGNWRTNDAGGAASETDCAGGESGFAGQGGACETEAEHPANGGSAAGAVSVPASAGMDGEGPSGPLSN